MREHIQLGRHHTHIGGQGVPRRVVRAEQRVAQGLPIRDVAPVEGRGERDEPVGGGVARGRERGFPGPVGQFLVRRVADVEAAVDGEGGGGGERVGVDGGELCW